MNWYRVWSTGSAVLWSFLALSTWTGNYTPATWFIGFAFAAIAIRELNDASRGRRPL